MPDPVELELKIEGPIPTSAKVALDGHDIADITERVILETAAGEISRAEIHTVHISPEIRVSLLAQAVSVVNRDPQVTPSREALAGWRRALREFDKKKTGVLSVEEHKLRHAAKRMLEHLDPDHSNPYAVMGEAAVKRDAPVAREDPSGECGPGLEVDWPGLEVDWPEAGKPRDPGDAA